jgi:hypothetical protein
MVVHWVELRVLPMADQSDKESADQMEWWMVEKMADKKVGSSGALKAGLSVRSMALR